MLAELLLVLSGHPSSFFLPTPSSNPTTLTLSPSLSSLLHPGESASLSTLAELAFAYSRIRRWAESVRARGQQAVLDAALGKSGQNGRHEPVSTFPDREGEDAPGVYLAALASSVLFVLGEYELLVVEVESKVLTLEPALVQDQLGYVPLSSLVAAFDSWQAPLASLSSLIDSLSSFPPSGDTWTPGHLIQTLYERSQTGNPRLESIYTTLLSSLRILFLTHLTAFIVHGLAPATSPPTSPAVALDTGSDPLSPQHRVYALNPALFPTSIGGRTRESVLYIGRVAATLKREGRSLPRALMDSVREEVMAVQGLDEAGGLDDVVQRARAEVGEWLWKHILTGPQVVEAITAFGDYFLTRNAEYTVAVVRELGRLRLTKLVTSNPTSSSSVIREQDVNLALLRASVGTSAETDRALERLRWKMPRGPLRPLSRPAPTTTEAETDAGSGASPSPVRDLFSSSVLGTPLELSTTVSWPLDLFMTPPAVSAYADIHAYLFAIKDTHVRVLDCWTSLSASQRQRRKFTGASEGGTTDEAVARRALARSAWALVRAMLFFLDQLQSHFMTDVIDVQHRRLLEQLESVSPGLRGSTSAAALSSSLRSARVPSPARSRRGSTPIRPASPSSPNPETTISGASAPLKPRTIPPAPLAAPSLHGLASSTRSAHATGPTFLDFLTLRRVHTLHLAFLREGLLLTDILIATTVRDVLALCTRFAGLVERWRGDVVPELLMEGDVAQVVNERQRAVSEIEENLRDLFSEFFRALLDSQSPVTDNSADLAPMTSFSKTGGRDTTTPVSVSFSRSRALARSRMVSFTSRPVSRSFSRAVKNAGSGGAGNASAVRDERAVEAEAVMGRHVEQLLLRLDFNGVLTSWMDGLNTGTGIGIGKATGGGRREGLLAEGGLA